MTYEEKTERDDERAETLLTPDRDAQIKLLERAYGQGLRDMAAALADATTNKGL